MEICYERARRRRDTLTALAWVVVTSGYVLVSFAYAYPDSFACEAVPHLVASWIAIMTRTLLFHLGLLLAAVALGALVRRKWRVLIATTPLVAFAILPACGWRYSAPTAANLGPQFRVMTFNIMRANRHPDAIIAAIDDLQPDVLVLRSFPASGSITSSSPRNLPA